MSIKKTSNNLILHKRDLVLLKRSEEAKNIEIYGNMYECFKTYNTLSAAQLKEDIAFDDKARMILNHDTKMMMDRIKNEWHAKSSFEIADNEVHCQLCSRKTVYICYIENSITGEELHVGSECVKHYKDIKGAGSVISKVSSYRRDVKKDARQTEFDVALGENIDFCKNANNKIEQFPMVLPYKLHSDLKSVIAMCNRIRTVYISSGGDLSESINKFNLKMNEFCELYERAENCYAKNRRNPLLCTRKIADWLLKNGYKYVIENIQKANGILNEETLQFIYEPEFIKRNIFVFEKCLKQKDVTFLGTKGTVIRFKIQNDRFKQPIFFTMPIKDFMKKIGCHCLTQDGYRYSKSSLSASIEMTSENLKNVFNYYVSILNNTDCMLIFERRVSKYYWERKQHFTVSPWSIHSREIDPIYKIATLDTILTFIGDVLFIDGKSEKEISEIIIGKIKKGGKWIPKEEKNRGVKIAVEAAGMQKRREFIPYS